MPKNYLLIYSEQLATEIELLCKALKHRLTLFSKFVKVQAVFMQISVKQIMGRVKRICFQNLKLLLRNVAKPKVGYVYCSIRMRLMNKTIKSIEIFAVESDEC